MPVYSDEIAKNKLTRMDWTAGYASDIEYTAGFYGELSSARLNFTCVLNGLQPIPLGCPYTYFKLGFWRGLTVNLRAAANPQVLRVWRQFRLLRLSRSPSWDARLQASSAAVPVPKKWCFPE